MSNSRCVNTVILLGNCGKDPEIRYTASGKPLAKLSLALNENFKANEGRWQERTHWVMIVAWERLAEIVGEYVQQGTRLYVQGRLNSESWDDRKSGEKHYRISVVADKLIILGNSKGVLPKDQNSRPEKQKENRSNRSDAPSQDSDLPF
jgi:single-strand DNA-binding protein